MFNFYEAKFMKNLSIQEIELVSGGWFKEIVVDAFEGANEIFERLPETYEKGIDALSEMMCIATNNC